MADAAFCTNCAAPRGTGAFCGSCGRPYERAASKGWPVYIWLPAMILVGALLIYLIAGVPVGR